MPIPPHHPIFPPFWSPPHPHPPFFPGVPSGLNVIEIGEKLCSVKGVVAVHSLCIWSINVEYVAVAAHLALNKGMTNINS